MKKEATLLLMLVLTLSSYAQLNIYSALTIPDSLKKDANMVIREESIKLSIKDKNTAWYEVHQVFTVMNEQAKKYLSFVFQIATSFILSPKYVYIKISNQLKKHQL